jgi:hypothetical protein
MHQIYEPNDESFSAFVGSMAGDDIGYYPIRKKSENNKYETINPGEVSSTIKQELARLNFKSAKEAQIHLDVVKTGYEEVKAATEYQDQKTARLLTILAFLTAAAGTVYGKMLDLYPLSRVDHLSWPSIGIALLHILFAAYFFMVASGALISFHATQTRFKATREQDTVTDNVKSLLFFKYISISSPQAWAAQFNISQKDLLTLYVKHYILETYLIAAKTSDKVRYLQPAQLMLQNAIRLLIAWIVLLAIAAITVPMTTKDTPHQTTAPSSPNS